MKHILRIFFGSIVATLALTMLAMVLPNNAANAISNCATFDDKFYTSSVGAYPSSAYAGDTVTVTSVIKTKAWASGNGYYSFSSSGGNVSWKTTSYISKNASVVQARYGLGTATIYNSGFTIYSYRNNGTLSNSCFVPYATKSYTANINIIPPVKPSVSWSISKQGSTHRWNDSITVYFNLSNSASGLLDFDLYGYSRGAGATIPIDNVPINNGSGSVTLPSSMLSFNVFDAECANAGGWFWDSQQSCSSTYWNNAGTTIVSNANRYLHGSNGISSIDYRSSDTRRWYNNTGNASGYPGAGLTWTLQSPIQVSDSSLYPTAVANGDPNIGGISKAGTISKTLPRISSSSCAKNQISCDGYLAYAKIGNGSYAWYALPMNNYATQAFFINCEPEGGGNVTFNYYDYGQADYNGSFYNTMMTNKDKTFNIKQPMSAEGYLGGSQNGILSGFPKSTDRWDTVLNQGSSWLPGIGFNNPNTFSQNWGNYLNTMGNPSCGYPRASAWMPSTTTISLPQSQWNDTAGKYVFSTVMPVKLATLEVRGGSGADNRTLYANPITIEVVGPPGRSRTTPCQSAAVACSNIAIPGGAFTTPGDYQVRACWGGQTSPGVQSRVFLPSCSGYISFKVYQTFACDFPENSTNNITIGPDAQGQVITGNNTSGPKIVRSGDKILVTYPNVTINNFKGLVDVPAPPAGSPQIKGRTRIVSGSDPYANSDVRLYDASGNEINSNRGGLEWNNNIEIANPINFISYYWPSSLSAGGRASIQIERRIWVWATAFDPTQPNTSPPVTQWWSCDTTDTPHSAWIQIINSQLSQ